MRNLWLCQFFVLGCKMLEPIYVGSTHFHVKFFAQCHACICCDFFRGILMKSISSKFLNPQSLPSNPCHNKGFMYLIL